DFSGDGFQPVVERVDQNDAEFTEELNHHPAESVGEIRARLVRIAKVFDEARHELRFGRRGYQLVDVLGDLFVQYDVAYGLAFFGRTAGVGDRDEMALAVDEAGVIDFLEVVVFGGDPEHGDHVEAQRAQVFGQLERGQSLEDSVERSGEKPGLLARDHDHGIF